MKQLIHMTRGEMAVWVILHFAMGATITLAVVTAITYAQGR
jgi:hypothetical protein